MRGFLVAGLAALTSLAACVDRQAATVAFSVEEAAIIRKTGAGAIYGHAFRTREKGQVVNAAGEVVRLIPATAYARERFRQFYGDGKYVRHSLYPRPDTPDPRYAEFTRSTKAEANGKFGFENVAPGTYFVTTQVIWGEEDAIIKEGGVVYDEVTLTGKEKEPVQVILSGK